MDTKKIQSIFIDIIAGALTNGEDYDFTKNTLTNEELTLLYGISKEHDLAHIVSEQLFKSGIELEGAIKDKFSVEQIMALCRYEQHKYTLEQISEIFEREKIAHIALKGSVIRKFYPEESMRTSCDIDILVKLKELKRAVAILEKEGFYVQEKGMHDVTLIAPNDVHLELHFCILEGVKKLDKILKNAWKYAEHKEGYKYAFNEEFFIFYTYAHMFYHFLQGGGCGVRSLMDIYIINNKMGLNYNRAKELLKKAGIYDFAVEMNNLVDICFNKKQSEEFYDGLIEYIVLGGSYGCASNKVEVKKSTGMIKYAFKRVFLPYRTMKTEFSILKPLPFLLPFCYIIRIFQVLFGSKRKRAKREYAIAKQVTQEKQDKMTNMRDRLGLNK